MRQFQTIDVMNTVGQWVDAFNNNALAASDHTWYLGEMLYNGMLYTGLETIGGVKLTSLTNLSISSISPRNVEFDNLYLYFRDINKILLVDQVTFDLSEFNTNQPTYLYINSNLGFRASQIMKQEDNEIMLFRFILSEEGVFKQCYITAQRFGSNVYDTADEFYAVKGCTPLPAGGLKLRLGDGTIKRSGIKFDYHQVPDVLNIIDGNTPLDIRYITSDNKIDFDAQPRTDVITNKMLDYTTGKLSNVPTGQFTAQRILYDVYTNCLIMQYGDGSYPDLATALSAMENLVYPFPYNTLMFIPIGIMFIQEGTTDLADATKCQLVQHLNTTVERGDSAFFAEDDYARGRLVVIQQQVEAMKGLVANAENLVNAHTRNLSNPHNVTKAQLGLGNVDNISMASMQDTFDGRYVRTDTTTQSVAGTKTFTGDLKASKRYIYVNGRKLYVGGSAPTDASTGDFWLPDA